MSMETDEPKFVQSAPELVKGGGEAEEKTVEPAKQKATLPSWGPQLKADELDDDADEFLCWITRYPVERNHPRPPTGVVKVTKSGDAVVCLATDKLTDILQKLIVEGFLSMPVISAQNQRLIGNIDLLDIVWYTLNSFGHWRQGDSSAAAIVSESREQFGSYLGMEQFAKATAIDILNRPNIRASNKPNHVFPGFSLMHVVETMARLSVHRVAICSSDMKITGLITQSMVISLLDQHLNRLGELATGHGIDEMVPGLVTELIVHQDTDMTMAALKTCVEKNVNGVAIVNAAGELVNTLSVRDLRGIGASVEEWHALWLPINKFKAHCRAKYPTQTPQAPIYVKKTDTLHRVIKLMDDGNIHRVFVCEENAAGKPVPTHVISQRDVLRYLLHLSGLKSTAMESTAIEDASRI